MPAPASLLVMRNMPTAMGAVTMPANVGGTRMRGFYNIAYLQHGGAQALCYESANAISL